MDIREIKTAGIVCCSNGLNRSQQQEIEHLRCYLKQKGIDTICSDYLYAHNDVRSGTAQQRANSLMAFYDNPKIDAIFDISGGDIANEVLTFLDFDRIAAAKNALGKPKTFWGYSDLTVLLNAIYTKTQNHGILYQIRHLPYADRDLFHFSYRFLQGTQCSGITVGGNIRCLLKLAGTAYCPDFREKILFLEARSGQMPQLITYFHQLKQMGVFEQIRGLLLGTFTQYEQNADGKELEELVLELAGSQLPIAKTQEIGHARNSKAIQIGSFYHFSEIE